MSRSDTTSGTGADLTADSTNGTVLGDPFIAPADGIYKLAYNLSGLDGSAATFTAHALHRDSDGNLLRRFSGFESKWIPTETVFGDDFQPIAMKSGEKLDLAIYSDNAGDDDVTWRRVVIDALYNLAVEDVATAAGVNVTITPAQAQSGNPRFSSMKFAPIAAGSGPTDLWDVIDSYTKEPIDLRNRALVMTFAEVTDAGDDEVDVTDDTIEWKFQYSDELSVGGTNHNQLTIVHNPAKTTTPGRYRAWLWDMTNESQPFVIVKADLPIEPAALPR